MLQDHPDTPWNPLDIPQQATAEDKYTLGAPGVDCCLGVGGLRESQLAHMKPGLAFIQSECYPVPKLSFTQSYSIIPSIQFFNIQLGVKEPSVYPTECLPDGPAREDKQELDPVSLRVHRWQHWPSSPAQEGLET